MNNKMKKKKKRTIRWVGQQQQHRRWIVDANRRRC